MQHFSICATLAALSILTISGCGPAKDPAPTMNLADAETRLRSEKPGGDVFDDMVRVLQLDTAAQGALRQAFSARDDAFEAWIVGPDGQRLIALEAEMFAAVEAKNLNEVKRTTSQATPLRNALRALVSEHDEAIRSVLHPDQRIQWDGHLVADEMLVLMQPLGLAFEQAQAVENGGVTAVLQAMEAGQPNPKAAAFLELEKWVEERVLSPEQRAAYQDIKASNKLRSLSI